MPGPLAARKPKELTIHGHTRVDDYFWLNQREDPEVLAYLEAENAYTKECLAPLASFEEALFAEIKGRIKEDDSSVPVRLRGDWYYTRYEQGHEYPLHCRRRGSLEAEEEVLLDVNELAEGHAFYAIGRQSVSLDGRLLAYAYDDQGRRIYSIAIKDLETGKHFDEVLSDCSGPMAWAADHQTLFYAKQDPQTLRSYRIYRHRLGTDQADDVVVFDETDETFNCSVGTSKSDQYIWIASHHSMRTEYRYLPADDPEGEGRVFLPREGDHEYYPEHLGDHFYICTNREGATNFKLMRCPITDTSAPAWEELIPHREDVLLENFELFNERLVLEERREGLLRIRLRRWDGSDDHEITFDDPTYVAGIGANPELDSRILRFHYTSLVQPNSVFDYDMEARERKLMKQHEVVGGYDASLYASKRLWASAPDGTKVPISIVHRKDRREDGSAPLLLYGYGSYGITIDASFSSLRLSLLDRGFAFAIAHVRGGQYLGRPWYDDGRKLKKKNSFTDFIACADHLVAEGWTRPEQLYAMGGSAGGLLMGAVINLRPELFHGIVAQVPFVDVVTTMLDESIPLTTGEYDEWGNPNEPEFYEYILSYSPYDQAEEQQYPNLFIATGLHDSQVQYWEPAKWIAKLRRLNRGDSRLLLKMNMDAGHGGASGRFQRYREIATEYAFLLDLEGIRE